MRAWSSPIVVGWLGWARSHFFRGLLEPFDFALGLGVVGLAIFLRDVRLTQSVFEVVPAACATGVSGGEHHPVIGQGRSRDPMSSNGLSEGGEHDWAGHPGVRGDRQGIAGAVIEPGQDLAVRAEGVVGVGEPIVGEVRLPALVGLVGFEPDVGALRALVRGGCDHTGPEQDPVDRRPRQGDPVMMGQVPADRVRPSI